MVQTRSATKKSNPALSPSSLSSSSTRTRVIRTSATTKSRSKSETVSNRGNTAKRRRGISSQKENEKDEKVKAGQLPRGPNLIDILRCDVVSNAIVWWLERFSVITGTPSLDRLSLACKTLRPVIRKSFGQSRQRGEFQQRMLRAGAAMHAVMIAPVHANNKNNVESPWYICVKVPDIDPFQLNSKSDMERSEKFTIALNANRRADICVMTNTGFCAIERDSPALVVGSPLTSADESISIANLNTTFSAVHIFGANGSSRITVLHARVFSPENPVIVSGNTPTVTPWIGFANVLAETSVPTIAFEVDTFAMFASVAKFRWRNSSADRIEITRITLSSGGTDLIQVAVELSIGNHGDTMSNTSLIRGKWNTAASINLPGKATWFSPCPYSLSVMYADLVVVANRPALRTKSGLLYLLLGSDDAYSTNSCLTW